MPRVGDKHYPYTAKGQAAATAAAKRKGVKVSHGKGYKEGGSVSKSRVNLGAGAPKRKKRAVKKMQGGGPAINPNIPNAPSPAALREMTMAAQAQKGRGRPGGPGPGANIPLQAPRQGPGPGGRGGGPTRTPPGARTPMPIPPGGKKGGAVAKKKKGGGVKKKKGGGVTHADLRNTAAWGNWDLSRGGTPPMTGVTAPAPAPKGKPKKKKRVLPKKRGK